MEIASYLTAQDHAAQYRLIVDVLFEAQAVTLTGVGRDELLAALGERVESVVGVPRARDLLTLPVLDLDARMQQLAKWGVVHSWQDQARTEADFVRSRDRYQLTTDAADLHGWLRERGDDQSAMTSAAAFAPAVIADRLNEVLEAVTGKDYPAAAQAWSQVGTTLKTMADAARVWQSRMASALAGAPDEGKIERLRETVMSYITVWGAGIDTYTARIRDAVGELDRLGPQLWREVAVVGLDPGAGEELISKMAQVHEAGVDTLRAWFAGPDTQASRLRRQVRNAVSPLLRGTRALLSTGGHITRQAELFRVAAAIEEAPDDQAAWRMWCQTTGQWSAQHLPGESADPPVGAARTSFWEAPPVPIDAVARQRARGSSGGPAGQVPNRRVARDQARWLLDQQRREQSAAEDLLAARSGSALSSWAPLGLGEAALFWGILAAVGSARTTQESQVRRVTTADGRWQVIAHPPARPTESACVRTPAGDIVCPDWTLELIPA
ncbi:MULTISPECIES: DUF2397 domain-containing protein [unclassified Crossiella]|uniref:DUF2397 domain-containing protein n=1 Tax=unclassified Crossiella TaxID=2620835 RepID=UPI001FFED99B|nr:MULTISPECIES: DUF2397 domain-containing protein [unclassified Crossiella]MCK2258873.1 DUF2397 domain-containing protein [Crossiella sp. S99.1]